MRRKSFRNRRHRRSRRTRDFNTTSNIVFSFLAIIGFISILYWDSIIKSNQKPYVEQPSFSPVNVQSSNPPASIIEFSDYLFYITENGIVCNPQIEKEMKTDIFYSGIYPDWMFYNPEDFIAAQRFDREENLIDFLKLVFSNQMKFTDDCEISSIRFTKEESKFQEISLKDLGSSFYQVTYVEYQEMLSHVVFHLETTKASFQLYCHLTDDFKIKEIEIRQ